MISRARLHEADKRAHKRWQAIHGRWAMELAEPWQTYRKVTTQCSHACCGNPRRHFDEATLQERRVSLPEDDA